MGQHAANPLLGQEPDDIKKADPDDLRLWSVTTVIGCLDKPALVYWAADMTAQAAINDADVWQPMAAKDSIEAHRWLTGARFRKPAGQTRTAAELGTAVHAAIEDYTLTGKRGDVDAEVLPYMDQFDQWAQRFQPVYQAAEVTVYDPEFGIAGTCDAFLTVDGVRFIADYKTTRKSFDTKGKPTGPYPEVALQLAAYRHAKLAAVWRPRRIEQFRRRYYLLGEAERAAAVPVPEVDAGMVIHITPEHCHAYPVECGPKIYESFLYTLEVARWTFDVSKTVIGEILETSEV
jgi:hypothetical protein